MSETIQVDTARVEAREVEGELVILDLKGQRYLGGNRSTAVLWPLLVEGASREALAERLVGEWEIDADRAREDVDTLVRALDDLDLLSEDVVR
jgi:Coenzyme PQQ synthesis protein D (PqqD)